MGLEERVKNLATVNIFTEAKKPEWFAGRPFYIDFDKAYLLITDAWKKRVKGIPQGTFLLAFYENNNDDVDECLLLRTLKPTKLPTDNDVIASMIDYYKDNLKTSGKDNQLDDVTRLEYSFSGLECRILGTFYYDKEKKKLLFGADVENYYSAHYYDVYKPMDTVLERIVNFRDGNALIGTATDPKIGIVRYSSSLRFQEEQKEVPVYVSSKDFLGKRTALFGMTRTGKSNTVKKIIEATTKISNMSNEICVNSQVESAEEKIDTIQKDGIPRYKVGQIIFDINGEYANKNMQDEGTAIFEKYQSITSRYSVNIKPGFNVMKVNFYTDIEIGFELISKEIENEKGDYIKNFLAVDFTEPDISNKSEHTRWERKVAAYQCCLLAAGFEVPQDFKVKFSSRKEIDEILQNKIDPSKGISLKEAKMYWEDLVNKIEDEEMVKFFNDYRAKKHHDWLDVELKAILSILVKKKDLTGIGISGYIKFRSLLNSHTIHTNTSFEKDISNELREGRIVIIDLSQGDPKLQASFSNRICLRIFQDSMKRFIENKSNNFIQFYFEEAHNLFPKKDDKDLTGIYNRLAKEGAKLNIGLIYATQEVSSISSNILKNTQNWFIAHLNNEDELKEIRKFYDFADFCDGLVRYSAGNDKGFIRMKTYSNAFVVPVQIDKFTA